MLVVRADGFVDPCIPTLADKPPSGPGWVHEIKHDGYRLIVRRDGETVRLFTRRGYDWTDRYRGTAVTASKLRAKSFILDGEAAVCGPDGIAVFERACVRCHLTTTSGPSVAIRGARSAAGMPVIGFLSGFGRHWNQLAI
jgi:ATP-dependent DNA ligase